MAEQTKRRSGKRYAGKPYWQEETPKEARAGRTLLRYFVDAQRLQVCATYQDRDGNTQIGRVVTLDLQALATSDEARALLEEVLRDAR